MTAEQISIQIAAAQLGLITRQQALDAGMSSAAIDRRLASGRWRRVVPGVYAINGIPETYDQRLLAYVLAAAPAAASHRAAGLRYKLRGVDDEALEITTTRLRRFKGVLVHEDVCLEDDRLRTIDGIPVTSVERTLMDLAGKLGERRFEVALDDALARRLTTVDRLFELLERRGRQGRNGTRLFRDMLEMRAGRLGHSESIDETDARRALRQPGMPEPIVQHRVFDRSGRRLARIDLSYPDALLLIEIHSMRWHSSRQDLERDARRQNRLVAMGYTILIYTRADIYDRPDKMRAQVREIYFANLRRLGKI